MAQPEASTSSEETPGARKSRPKPRPPPLPSKSPLQQTQKGLLPGLELLAGALQVSKWDMKKLSDELTTLRQASIFTDATSSDQAELVWGVFKKWAHKFRDATVDNQKRALDGYFQNADVDPFIAAAATAGLQEVEAHILKAEAATSGNPSIEVYMQEVEANTPLKLPALVLKAGFKPEETLVAMDFDLTIKAPVRKNVLNDMVAFFGVRGGQRLHLLDELRELAAMGVETIVVSATRPEKTVWTAYDSIVKDAKGVGVFELMGQQFGMGPPDGIPYLQSETGVDKREELWTGHCVTEGKEGVFFQAGHGFVLAGYSKAEAIEHYIYYHGQRAKIKHIVFVDDAVNNAYTVPLYFKTMLNDGAFLKKTRMDASMRPGKSSLRRMDSLWWSTRGLILDTEGGQTVKYDVDAVSDGSADNSYLETEQYSMFRERVRTNNLLGPLRSSSLGHQNVSGDPSGSTSDLDILIKRKYGAYARPGSTGGCAKHSDCLYGECKYLPKKNMCKCVEVTAATVKFDACS